MEDLRKLNKEECNEIIELIEIFNRHLSPMVKDALIDFVKVNGPCFCFDCQTKRHYGSLQEMEQDKSELIATTVGPGLTFGQDNK